MARRADKILGLLQGPVRAKRELLFCEDGGKSERGGKREWCSESCRSSPAPCIASIDEREALLEAYDSVDANFLISGLPAATRVNFKEWPNTTENGFILNLDHAKTRNVVYDKPLTSADQVQETFMECDFEVIHDIVRDHVETENMINDKPLTAASCQSKKISVEPDFGFERMYDIQVGSLESSKQFNNEKKQISMESDLARSDLENNYDINKVLTDKGQKKSTDFEALTSANDSEKMKNLGVRPLVNYSATESEKENEKSPMKEDRRRKSRKRTRDPKNWKVNIRKRCHERDAERGL